LCVLCATALVVACSGEIAGGDRPSTDGSGGGGRTTTTIAGAGGSSSAAASQPGVGRAGLRRLTAREYDNSVAALLGDDGGASRSFVGHTASPALGYHDFRPVGDV